MVCLHGASRSAASATRFRAPPESSTTAAHTPQVGGAVALRLLRRAPLFERYAMQAQPLSFLAESLSVVSNLCPLELAVGSAYLAVVCATRDLPWHSCRKAGRLFLPLCMTRSLLSVPRGCFSGACRHLPGDEHVRLLATIQRLGRRPGRHRCVYAGSDIFARDSQLHLVSLTPLFWLPAPLCRALPDRAGRAARGPSLSAPRRAGLRRLACRSTGRFGGTAGTAVRCWW